MNRPKQRKNKRLLELLGADPHEPVPTFEEACDSVPREVYVVSLCPSSGKQSFASESAARRAATNRMNKGSGTGSLRVYRCPECRNHHLSSSFFR